MNNVFIILVKPQLGQNIGSVARVMKNLNFKNLRIVNPRDGWPNKKAETSAKHAKKIIDISQEQKNNFAGNMLQLKGKYKTLVMSSSAFNVLSTDQKKLLESMTDFAICNVETIEKIINYPCFVKPANMGSSIGITKAYSKQELVTGIEIAAKYDERIIVEKNIEGRELECGVLGKSIMKSSVVGEVKFQTDWYTYESKYNEHLSTTIIPADLKINISNKIQKLAIEACKAINAYGLARVDFFYQESTQQIYINEVNTLPGFTKTSMYPTLWEASGLKLEKLVASLIETAKE